MSLHLRAAVFLAALVSCTPAAAEDAAEPLTIYSSRKAQLIQPVLDAYREKTGTRFQLLTGQPGPLLERIKTSGTGDILITVDAGNLWHAADRYLFLEIDSPVLAAAVPSALRDPNMRWFGLSMRARTLVYNPERMDAGELFGYEHLAREKWKGRLCLRTSRKVYNQSLVASLIARHGEPHTEQIVRRWVDNLARAPFSNDTKALQAVAAGLCDVTIVNTYYLARLQRENPELPLRLFWANQDGRGVHVNVSGGGVLKLSKQPERAQAFLEWLVSAEAQKLFAELNLEFPVREGVEVHPLVERWGPFHADDWNISEAGRLQGAAVKLMDRAGYR